MENEATVEEITEAPIEAPLADIEAVLGNLRATIGNLAQENAILHAQLVQVLSTKTE